MGKDCGRGNERLHAKALAVYHVAEGEGGGGLGRKIPPDFPACASLSKGLESLKKETLHVVIHHFIMHVTFQKKGYVAHAFWNFAA